MELTTEQDFKSFVFAISGLMIDEYAKKILDEFNQEKHKEKRGESE